MKINVISVFKGLSLKFFESLKRYPEPLMIALLSVIMLIIVNHLEGNLHSPLGLLLQRITLVLLLGFPVSLCLKVFFERNPDTGAFQKSICYALAAGSLLVYFFLILPNLQLVHIMRYAAVTVALYFFCPVIPYFYKRESFERFIIYLLARLLITGIYAMVLYLGLIAMLFTINTLFSAGISEKLYLDLYFIAIGVFSPSFFLADIPRYGQELPRTDYPKGLKIMLLYILVPILAAYSLILYAYFGKILFTHVWPSGMVANLVLWYSFISLAVLFLIFPLRKSDNVAKWFILILPKAILPLLLMMFVSVGIRLGNYGITEGRYFVMVAGAWVFGYMIYIWVKNNSRNILIPISFSIIAILTIVGPWSAFSISKNSQNARFEKLLMKNNLLDNGVIVKASQEVPEEDRKEISAILYYFKEVHKFSELSYLPKYFNLFQTQRVFGFRLYEDQTRNFRDYFYFYYVLQPQEIYSMKGFDYFSDLTFEKTTDYNADLGPITVDYSSKTRILRILKEDKEIYRGSPDGIALKIANAYPMGALQNAAVMSQEDQNENVKVLYLFKKVQGSVSKKTGKSRFEVLRFYFFIKLKTE